MVFIKSAFILLFIISISHQEDVLDVSVYYEALCPDSKLFIARQLYPAYLKLEPALNLELIPYGKAIQNKVNGQWKFECQHGPDECYGNTIQACLLKTKNLAKPLKMKFINCVMSRRFPLKFGQECAEQIGVSWPVIDECANSTTGSDLLAAYGDRTHAVQPKISFVPTIVFDNNYNETLQQQALRNFKKTVCNLIPSLEQC